MREAFEGTEVGVETDAGVHLCGVRSDGDEHVLFQRAEHETSPSDIHFEYRDQGHGGYDAVRRCRLTRDQLNIDLSRPLRSYPELQGIDIALRIDDASYGRLSDGLAVIFGPCSERLVIA